MGGFVWQNMPDWESNGVGWVYRLPPPVAAAWETETGGVPERSRTFPNGVNEMVRVEDGGETAS